VESQKPAVARHRPVQNDRGKMIYAVVANGCSHNNGIRHVIAKKQLHCNRKAVFYAVRDEMLQLGEENWLRFPDGYLTQRQSDQLTFCRNITLTLSCT
jgi:hypothetical protein